MYKFSSGIVVVGLLMICAWTLNAQPVSVSGEMLPPPPPGPFMPTIDRGMFPDESMPWPEDDFFERGFAGDDDMRPPNFPARRAFPDYPSMPEMEDRRPPFPEPKFRDRQPLPGWGRPDYLPLPPQSYGEGYPGGMPRGYPPIRSAGPRPIPRPYGYPGPGAAPDVP